MSRLQDDLGALEQLLEQVDAIPDPIGRAPREAVELLVRVYGDALARMLEHMSAGSAASDVAADQELAPLLLAHGLHPDGVEERVERALDEVRPYIESHRGEISLIGIEGETAVVRMSGTCDGCASSEVTLHHAVEEVVLAAAPELSAVRAETSSNGARTAVIPVEQIMRAPKHAEVTR